MNGFSGLFGRQLPGMQMDPRLAALAEGRPMPGGMQMDAMRSAMGDPQSQRGTMLTPGQSAGGDDPFSGLRVGPGGVPPSLAGQTNPQAPPGGGFLGKLGQNLQKPGTMNLAAGMIGAALAPKSQQGEMLAGGMMGATAANQKAEQAKAQQAMMQRQMQRQQMMDAHNMRTDNAKLGLAMQKQNPGALPKAPDNIDWENPAQVGAYLQSDPRLRPIFESWAKRQGGGVPGFF